ncbi:MAG: endonuclease/exonuclease/phosphatase family protein [Alphaproteobacteria bacterium]|nr:endonuclease/exonuclease/phosphatase family protein [Alphaproteobacteria bacterium]
MEARLPFLSRLWWRPEPREPVHVDGTAPCVESGRRLRVLSWNVQFCAGRRCFFFYDGGRDARVTAAEVRHTLDGVVEVIRRASPDLVFLQEVDRHSARTAWIDQHAELARRLGYPVAAHTTYFRVPFVPVPPHAPMGRVDMGLTVLSRFRLDPGERIALAPLAEPRWRRAFNLRRALQHLELPVQGGPPIHLFHTHLSAFSRGDGTLEQQVRTVVDEVGRTRGPALLVGDLNSLPPGDPPSRLGASSVLYAERTPIEPLYDALDPLFPPAGGGGTYVPWGSNLPDRTIDYVFGREVLADRAVALASGAAWSDHLPIQVDVVPTL